MTDSEPDKEPAKSEAEIPDAAESLGLMEPMRVSDGSRYAPALTELSLELATRSTGLLRSLPEGISGALADLVRSMNCYYSNLIEGHDTHPIDIERALEGDYSHNPEKRNLQLEAKAHIEVQRWIDGLDDPAALCSIDGIREIHRRFCELMPDELLWVEDPESGMKEPVIAGEYRTGYAKVGRHIAVSPGAIDRFLSRYEGAYKSLGKSATIVATAAAHHRLLWIHPFADGNGRVTRLLSYALLKGAMETGGIWSVARGLARNAGRYKSLLATCDQPRRNDLDGRGTLSEEELASFSRFFLETCIDQVDFMEKLMEPQRLRDRIILWAEEEIRAKNLPPKSVQVLDAILLRGQLARGDVESLLDVPERTARRITSALLKSRVLSSESTRAPLKLAFPAALAGRFMPGLFPDAPYEES